MKTSTKNRTAIVIIAALFFIFGFDSLNFSCVKTTLSPSRKRLFVIWLKDFLTILLNISDFPNLLKDVSEIKKMSVIKEYENIFFKDFTKKIIKKVKIIISANEVLSPER